MHEAALMKDLMKKILQTAKEQGAKRVVGIKVKLGALSHLTPEHFREHFEEVSPGTLAAGARIQAEQSTDIHDPKAQEVILQSIEVED